MEKRNELIMKRRQSLMPQIEVAAKIGVSQGCYSNFENGYADPNVEQAKILIEMFDLPEDYFGSEGEEENG